MTEPTVSRMAAELVQHHPRPRTAGLPRLTWVVTAMLEQVDEYLGFNRRYCLAGSRELFLTRVVDQELELPPPRQFRWFVEVFGRAPLPGEEEELSLYDSSRPSLTGAQLLEVLGVARLSYAKAPRIVVLPEALHLPRLLPALGFYLARKRSGGVSHEEVLDSLGSYLAHDPPPTLGNPGASVFDNPTRYLLWYSRELGRYVEDCLSKKGYWRERAAPLPVAPADIPDLTPLPTRGRRGQPTPRTAMPPPPRPENWGPANQRGGGIPPLRLLPHARQESVDNRPTTDDFEPRT